MKKKLVFILLIFITCVLHSQNRGAYLVPRIIYVGDTASFVLPLPVSSQNEDFIINSYDSDSLPADSDIDFHRIILERRTMGSRLIIEFTPFAAGVLELPGIEIGGEYFSGFTVMVNSILDSRSAPVLSAAASALAMPGTAAMIYGSMAVIVILILFTFWFVFKGRTVLHKLRERWKRLRLFNLIHNTERRLYKAVTKGADKRNILDKLSEEFKNFLSILTGNNCRAMTAREFSGLFFEQENSASFLKDFFRRCDELRFSGSEIKDQDIFSLLSELHNFINMLEDEEKLKTGRSRELSL
jgi:hypothetical protein